MGQHMPAPSQHPLFLRRWFWCGVDTNKLPPSATILRLNSNWLSTSPVTAGISTLCSLQRKLNSSYFSSSVSNMFWGRSTLKSPSWRNCNVTWWAQTLYRVFHCCNLFLCSAHSAQGPKPSTRKRWHGGQLPLDDADPAESHQGLRLPQIATSVHPY